MADILTDPFVEATARLLCRDAGLDPDIVVAIPGAEATIGGVRQPVQMTGPQWIAYAVEASERIADTGRRMAAQFVRTPGRG